MNQIGADLEKTEGRAKDGFLYVLSHPSDPLLYKIGMTSRRPESRLVEHNTRFTEYTGKIVKDTGLKWELKTFIPVLDTYWAEAVFWTAVGLADLPYRGGIEVARLDWDIVMKGLESVRQAGVRPPPGPLMDHVYANRAWMKKRLDGRGIALLGHVRSKSGKSDFRCDNAHEWRAVPNDVAKGGGCPHCGIGKRTPEEIVCNLEIGELCLLVHPDRAGSIRLGLKYESQKRDSAEDPWSDWHVHRYKNVEEPLLAQTLFWELLEVPQPRDGEEIQIDLSVAEKAFRDLHFCLVSKIANIERAKDCAEIQSVLKSTLS